jgi:hypothetical protein
MPFFTMLSSNLPYNASWTAKLLRRDARKFIEARRPSVRQQAKKEEVMNDRGGARHIEPLDVAASTVEPVNTLYELLDSRLKALYASRDRYAAHEVRWKFRGSWLLLHMAIQACPSNDSYDIFRNGRSSPEKGTFSADLLMNTTKVSKMPAQLYTSRISDDSRIDSVFHLAPTRTPPPASQIWFAMLEAANDSTKMIPLAENILQWVWPEKNAVDIIDQLGNPGKRFSDTDDAELCRKLRELLFRNTMHSPLSTTSNSPLDIAVFGVLSES